MSTDDHASFLRLEGTYDADGSEVVISHAAFQLHGFAIVNSVPLGHPGFASDDYLNTITAETSVTAAELCTAGLWERVDEGYRIHDDHMVNHAVWMHERVERGKALCRDDGAHTPSADNPGLCDVCLELLPDTEGD